MKALLQKDLYETVTSMRAVFVAMLLFGTVALISPNSSFFVPYLVILPGTIVSSILNFEEQNGWMVYAGTLPCRRRTQVAEKYLFGALLSLFGSSLALLVLFVYGLRGKEAMGVGPALATYLGIGLIAPALLLPFAYWLGAEKGRYITMFLIIFMIMIILTKSGSDGSVLPASVPAWAFLPACIVLYLVSMYISMRVYEKKELTR